MSKDKTSILASVLFLAACVPLYLAAKQYFATHGYDDAPFGDNGVTPGTYATRNGLTAIVDKTDLEGMRPVRATIKGDGPDYIRYFTADGYEFTTGEESPYDLISRK
jgi:hypothetical protein